MVGLLVDGKWVDEWYDTTSSGGRFVRQDAGFREHVTPDGRFRPEAGRYRLYVSYACPWAHRTLIYRSLKGLEDAIAVTVVKPLMLENGWELPDGGFLYELYARAKPDYTGRVTVPVLWDERTGTIVSNESAEIIRMFDGAFEPISGRAAQFTPAACQNDIDEINRRVYHTVNNGVYRCGFATTQYAYEEAFSELFGSLDWLEDRLSKQRYLCGDRLTEADWRLLTTLLRFDAVYYGHFKCNLRRLVDFPNLWDYTRELYQYPGVAETVHFDHIKSHYYGSHETINPTRIVPGGPEIDWNEPHTRGA